jgi:mono/diheme cytochrome c family protein
MTRSSLCLAALFFWAGSAGAASGENVIEPATIYQESCSVCHGDDGRGAVWGQASLSVPPRNFRTAEARQELTRERMVASVTAGRPGTPMPGFGTQLSIAEINAVVDWIRAEFMTPELPAATGPHGHRLPGNTEYGPIGRAQPRPAAPQSYEGDPGKGALLYAQNCVACHGANGGGDGPRAYFIFPRPRNFHDPATRAYLTRQNLYNGIKFGVVGKEMPAWGKVLSDAQIADLAEYVYRQFIDPQRAN